MDHHSCPFSVLCCHLSFTATGSNLLSVVCKFSFTPQNTPIHGCLYTNIHTIFITQCTNYIKVINTSKTYYNMEESILLCGDVHTKSMQRKFVERWGWVLDYSFNILYWSLKIINIECCSGNAAQTDGFNWVTWKKKRKKEKVKDKVTGSSVSLLTNTDDGTHIEA